MKVYGKVVDNCEIHYGHLDCKVEQNGRLKCSVLIGRGATVRAGATGSAWSTARISYALVTSGKAVAYHLYKFNEDQ